MRASRYMILLYASMLAVPLLFLILAIAEIAANTVLADVSEILAAAGLVVYGIVGFIEVFGRRAEHANSLGSIAGRKAADIRKAGSDGGRKVRLEIGRFISDKKALENDTYEVSANRFTTVLDALLSVKEKQDNTLAVRYSCRMGICGSCGIVINGKPSLACETCLLDVARDGKVDVEPMQAHPLLKDLVTDFDDFFEKHKSVKPWLYRKNAAEQNKAASVYAQTGKERDEYLPFSYCIMCGICMDACPVVNSNPKFVGPQALSQEYRYHKDSRDQMGARRLGLIDSLDGVWGCEYAGACSEVCPKGVDPAAAIQALKFEMFGKVMGDEDEGK